jgi:hypothetical protein
MSLHGVQKSISLPTNVDAKEGDIIVLTNRLPENIADGSTLMVRTSLSDFYIYINGELRESYDAGGLSYKTNYNPSSYVVTELSEDDSSAVIKLVERVKVNGNLNEVYISRGNNAWFYIIRDNILVVFLAMMVLIMGVVLSIVSRVMYRAIENSRAAINLGLLMGDISIWIISESRLRQLIMNKPSLSMYFANLSVEMIGIFACMFFDEVQHRKHHKGYAILEFIVMAQILVNIALHFSGVAELSDTLIFAHFWMGIGIVYVASTIVMDIHSKEIKKYIVVAGGMAVFALMSALELLGYYFERFHVYGTCMSIGMIILAITMVVQILIDQTYRQNARSARQTKMMVSTIKTIAGSIDAKDKYTGGHSERVGAYAAVLARGMSEYYGFSENDIKRIHYIGIMHDIGKIGVTDAVLNKPGKLTKEEFDIMKSHTTIGAEIMKGMEDEIPGLVEGIKYHHERFDGHGYPEGLFETEIPLIARILCLVDSYDAMTTDRVYRARLTDAEVRAEFVRCSGTQFDPALTEIFIDLLDSGQMRPSEDEDEE